MKQTMRIWLVLVLALCAGTTAWAAPTYQLTTGTLTECTVAFSGEDVITPAAAIEGATVTITVTPNEGFATKGITVKAFMSTNQMRSMSADISLIEDIEVTQDAADSNVFTFTMPAADIVVDATTTKIIQSSWIQTIDDQTYTGSAITPEIVVKDGDTTLTPGEDYTVAYSNNTAAALSTDAMAAPTVTITALGVTYSDAAEKASANFTINKAAATISFAEATPASKKFNLDNFTNTLANTPAAGTDGTGLGTVVYTSSNTDVATVNATTGKVTFVSTGSTTITATVTDGTNYTYSGMDDYNSEAKTVSVTYTLTVEKGDITATASNVQMAYSPSGSYGITVNVRKPTSGATIMYGTTEGSYVLSASPTYSVIGTNTVYYKVTADNYNDFTGSATVTITKAQGSVNYSQTSVAKTYGDDSFVNAVTATGDGAVTYSSSNTSVATVGASTGLVTIQGVGTTTITATMAETETYIGNSARYTLTVSGADLSTAVVALGTTSYDYDGEAKEPAVLAVVLSGRSLTAGTDYNVSYANNVNAGTATATITGTGNYTGTASAEFTISPVTTTDDNITIKDGGDEKELTIHDMGNQQGSTVTPEIEVTTLNYYRSLYASDVNAYTVCLPYPPLTSGNLKYYTLTGAEGTTLQFEEISGAPQANTPYLVFASSTTDIGTENLSGNITMKKEVSSSSSASSYVLKGTLSGISHDDALGLYILQTGNRWSKVGSDTHAYIPPFRAYIESAASGARILDSSFDGETTGINSMRTIDRDGTERWFDLNGRCVKNPTKSGIYINNGRKEIIK